jgi:hypothetical protein
MRLLNDNTCDGTSVKTNATFFKTAVETNFA